MAIRILVCENGLGFGGSIRSLTGLLRRIDRARFEPILLLERRGADPQVVSPLQVKVIRGAQPFFELFKRWSFQKPISYVMYPIEFALCWGLQALHVSWCVIRHRIDVIHLNNHISDQIGGVLAAKLCRVPVICYLRNVRQIRGMDRRMAGLVDRFVVTSKHIREVYVRQGLPPDRIEVIYHVLEGDPRPGASSRVREEFGVTEHEKLFGVISRLSARKGYECFLQAARDVARSHPHVRFAIVGKEEEGEQFTSRLKQLADEYQLTKAVIFAGWRNDMADVITALDCVVDPSVVPEGSRRTILESLRLGRSIIATNVGGEGDFFDKLDRVFFEPNDVDALAQRMRWFLENPKQAQEVASAARERVLRYCDAARSARQLEQVYESVARRGT